MINFLLVCLGGAIGSGLRYLITAWSRTHLSPTFPYGTLIVNLLGCFVIAIIMHVALKTAMSIELRLLLTTGFLGGLTTYSAFNYETTALAQEGAARLAVINFAITTSGCLAAGLLGLALARRLAGA
ncbi:MAG TPA: fluoride efflux transporter CrcB [Kofleriaceae bacterium]|nr:fluoride efflux transporter CrcB [Kofleriaceae bacterium]